MRLILALAGGLAVTAMIVLLALVLGELQISRQHIEAQDAKAAAQLEALTPVLDDAGPVLEASKGAVRALRGSRPGLRQAGLSISSIGRSVESILESGQPVLRDLAGGDVAGALDAGRRLATAATPLLEDLDTAALNQAANSTDSVLGSLRAHDLARLISRVNDLASETKRRNLLARLDRTSRDVAEALDVQRATRRLQVQALSIQRKSLAIQKETLERAASLDEKTGGQAVR